MTGPRGRVTDDDPPATPMPPDAGWSAALSALEAYVTAVEVALTTDDWTAPAPPPADAPSGAVPPALADRARTVLAAVDRLTARLVDELGDVRAELARGHDRRRAGRRYTHIGRTT